MDYGKMRPDPYMPRIAERELSELLDLFGGIEVAGTMWCGKTWTSLAYAESVIEVGHPDGRKAAEADPGSALVGEKTHVIDEWQDVPAIWDAVRAEIDRSGSVAGQYILTGSSQPFKTEVHHSGAGRIGKMRMRTMSLYESGESSGKISLAGLFEGQFEPLLVNQKLPPLAESICRGGWPALVAKNKKNASRFINSYFDALFDVNIEKRNMDGGEARQVALSLARNSGSAVKLSTVAKDARFTDISEKSADAKAAAYIAALKDLYVVESISGWDAPIRSHTRLRTKPKLYFTDPSLTASLLQIKPERLITNGQVFGTLFESLCLRDLLVYASVMPDAQSEPIRYYRDSDGLEVDVIIELRDGRWAGIEIKLGENKADEGIASLKRLCRKIAANPAARNPEPEFLMVLVGAGAVARQDKESGVYIVPLTVLGP